jgi:uncharacterized protein (DUF697 family)
MLTASMNHTDRKKTKDPLARNGYWKRLRNALSSAEPDSDALKAAIDESAGRQPAPVVWLLGTTQSGKTAIVKALTGSSRAEIGNGFEPCTRTAQIYDFPQQVPVVRFLDTRGLGEVDYDPTEDLALCESSAHLVIAVMKVVDSRPDALLKVLKSIRRRHPDWPLVMAQTCLHHAFSNPADEHPRPYPFDQADWMGQVPERLRRLLLAQRQSFDKLPGSGPVFWVPIDFTRPEDGFESMDYGLDAFWSAVEEASALGLEARLRADPQIVDLYARTSHPHIVGYSLAAGAFGALPLVDLAAVPALQARMLHQLAGLYGLTWTARRSSEFLGLLGAGLALGYGLRTAGRSLTKLIPIWGQTAGAVWGAAASGSVTYALGKAACVYLHRVSEGLDIDADALRETYRQALRRGRELVRDQRRQ